MSLMSSTRGRGRSNLLFAQTRPAASWLALAMTALLSASCGGAAAFNTRFPDNRDADVNGLIARLRAAPARADENVAVGISAAPKRLYAFDRTADRVLWQKPLDATSAPYLAGKSVVVQVGGEIQGYDLATGRRNFSFGVGDMGLRGADGDAGRVAVVVGSGQGTYARAEVLLVEGGAIAWRREIDRQGGSPALVGDVVLVPWSSQYLSALDRTSGEEFARIRVNDGVISHALSAQGNVFLGSYHGIARLTSALASGSLRKAGLFSLPETQLPGRPKLLPDLYTMPDPPAPDSALHRIGLYWSPTLRSDGSIGLRDDTLYLVFYRFAFALDPASYAVRWIYPHNADIVGAAAQAGGLALADERGHFLRLDAGSGSAISQTDSGLPSLVVSLSSGGGGAAAAPSGGPDPSQLRKNLVAAAQDTDARLVPAQLFAVSRLAAMEDAEATANLVSLCDDTHIAPPLRQQACNALRDRTLGTEHLLTALERHASYLEGTSAPPSGALAKAAASQKVTKAVPLLVAHLRDPGTSSRDLPAIVEALGRLGDPAAAGPLADFLKLYHADPIDEHLVRALELIPQALVDLGAKEARPALESVAGDELGSYPVRQRAQGALGVLRAAEAAAQAEKEKAEQIAEGEQTEGEAPPEGTPEDTEPEMPARLTLDLVAKTLLPVRDQLRACLTEREKPEFQARVVLVVEDGLVLMASVLPSELQSCIEPLIRSQRFPVTKVAKREQITYVIKRQ